MRLTFFVHSLLSCWNHGNAHFLRGLVGALTSRGHGVRVLEPRDAWSVQNLLAEPGGAAVIEEARAVYPALAIERYDPASLDLERAIADSDVVVVHEWSDHELVRRLGEARRLAGESARGAFTLLFHDTHHRSVTEAEQMSAYDLRHYDGALAFGAVIRDLYLARGWCRRAFTFHEAADVRVFAPRAGVRPELDLVWIGNWGDDEREQELQEFLLEPVKRLGLRARVHGVRYPDRALAALREAGIEFGGWLPNHRAPDAFARARVTVHVPRRPYAARLPGIPTIRPFEALACGIPLVSAPWSDVEGLFRPGVDFLGARDGDEMTTQLDRVLTRPDLARALAASGRERVLARHTCGHRADELLAIVDALARSRATDTPACAPEVP